MKRTHPMTSNDRGAILPLVFGCLMAMMTVLPGCRNRAAEMAVWIDGKSDLVPESSRYAGALPERTDCAEDHCMDLNQEVVLEVRGCRDCAAAAWSVRDPSGQEVLRGSGARMRFRPERAGTWLVGVEAEGAEVAHFLIVRPDASREDAPVAAPEPVEVTAAPPVRTGQSAESRKKEETSLKEEEGARPAAAVVPPAPPPVAVKPLNAGLARLEVKGDQLRLSGLEDGSYRVRYAHNGQDKEQRVDVRKGLAVWPDRLDAGRRHEIRVSEIERVSDGQRAEVRLLVDYGEEPVAAAPVPVKPAAPEVKKPGYAGKTGWAGRKAPATAPDCAASWVSRAEVHLEASAMCRPVTGWLWAEQTGDLELTLKGEEGTRSITKGMSRGKNIITLRGLYPELGPGEKLVLVLEGKGGLRFADLGACDPASSVEKPLRVTYPEGRICLTDIFVHY